VVLWGALLVAAVWSAPRAPARKTTIVLALALAGQLVLHLVFGVETFLYSAHWGGLLVLLGAATALTAARRFTIPLCVALVVIGGWNNLSAFTSAAARLRGNYEHERAFASRLVERTHADDLMVCGREAAATVGLDERNRPVPSVAPVTALIFEPERMGARWCAFRFDEETAQRRGWIISLERWSMENIETFRERGARYFVTPYAFGIAQRGPLFDELSARYRVVERTDGWAMYDLSPR
jgi:hypothetical protein